MLMCTALAATTDAADWRTLHASTETTHLEVGIRLTDPVDVLQVLAALHGDGQEPVQPTQVQCNTITAQHAGDTSRPPVGIAAVDGAQK